MPSATRSAVVVSLGLWLAMLLALLLGSATMLALGAVSVGDMRWIGTDVDVTTAVVDRMAVFVALAVITATTFSRAWARPSTPAADAQATSLPADAAVQAAVIRLVAGGALVLTVAAGMVVVSLARVFA